MKSFGVGLIGFVITSLCYVANAVDTDPLSVNANLGSNIIPDGIEEGDDIYITCDVKPSSIEVNKVNWFHDGKEVIPDLKSGIIIANKNLALRSIGKLSSGKYVCQVITSNGTLKSDPLLVNVKDKPHFRNNTTISTSTAKPKNSSNTRFELSGFNKDSLNNVTAGQNVTLNFNTDQYRLDYEKSAAGDVHFVWYKGNVSVEMHMRSSDGKIAQWWFFPGAEVALTKTTAGDKEQLWTFPQYTYTYTYAARFGFSDEWAVKGVRLSIASDIKTEYWDSLKLHQNLISEWCDQNSFLMKERSNCVIY